jgi:pSer/pThr/pTyr-binding forkhead associated (FHA) protein
VQKAGILKVLDRGEVVDTFALMRVHTIIGRDTGDLCLEDPEVSGQHCKISFIDGDYSIIDLGSTNGTFLNSVKISKQKLNVGDLLRIGKIEFLFDFDESLSWEPPPSLGSDTSTNSPELERLMTLISQEKKRIATRNTLLLEIMYQDSHKETVNLKVRNVELGRTSSIARFAQDEELSRRHAKIWINEDGHVYIADQKSMNGTFINGEKIVKNSRLNFADEVRIGRIHFRVSLRMNPN